ncbi:MULTISPECIES: KilA-N domain-containing protein [Methylobacter]
MKNLVVQDTLVSLTRVNDDDYISLTGIACVRKHDEPQNVVKNWLRNRYAVRYLGLWEKINNATFKVGEFDFFRLQTGSNSFILSPNKWIEATGVIGIKSTAGRGSAHAHRDIAFEFASWVSAEIKLYLIKDFQRLKEEAVRLGSGWDIKRSLARINYKIHTDAIKETIIPHNTMAAQTEYTYASEADLLNVALWDMTAKEWQEHNPDQLGNIRDASTIEQFVVLSNLESLNAAFIRQGLSQPERLKALNELAIAHNTVGKFK